MFLFLDWEETGYNLTAAQFPPHRGIMQNCENCFGRKWFAKIDKKTGLQVVHSDGRRVWKCWRCGHVQEERQTPVLPKIYRSRGNILYIDLEVSKSAYFNYGARVPSKYLRFDDIIHEYYIICWAASYIGSEKIYSESITPNDAKNWNDAKILNHLHDLMQSADIIAGHNVDAYDMKRAQTRFLLNGISPVTDNEGRYKKTQDTLKIARSKFAFESNCLDYISQRLGLGAKDKITNEDWLKIVKEGDEKTLNKVHRYCRGDVKNGKGVYDWLIKYSGKRMSYGSIEID
jgi:Zn-finger protein